MNKVAVIWSTEALVDLENISDFLAEKSPSGANRIVENILSRTRQIENFPGSGAEQKTLKNTGREYHYLVEGNYKIIYSYQAERQAVYVEIIFDTRQNPDDLKV